MSGTGEAGVQVPLLPVPGAGGLLNRTFGCVRYVYNRALAERSRAWTQGQERVTFAGTCRMLTAWKAEPETAWLHEVSNVALQQGLQHLQQAYVNFWGKRGRYPQFKAKHKSRASATFTTSGFSYRDGRVKLAKMTRAAGYPLVPAAAGGRGAVHGHRVTGRGGPLAHLHPGRNHGKDTASAGLGGRDRRGDNVPAYPLDRGEDHQPEARAPRPGAARESAAEPGPQGQGIGEPGEGPAESGPRPRPDRRPAHRFPPQGHDRLVRENQALAIEDLSVRNMVTNHSLARAISDASWSELRRQLEYKADWYGRTVIAVDRFYPSSKTCSACGVIAAKMPLNVREWQCARCGASHDRDVNAAKVIRAEGLSVLACGDGIRPARA